VKVLEYLFNYYLLYTKHFICLISVGPWNPEEECFADIPIYFRLENNTQSTYICPHNHTDNKVVQANQAPVSTNAMSMLHDSHIT
jgi:hypothetical protein